MESNLRQLGHKTPVPTDPDQAELERIPVEMPALRAACIRFSCPEFTSLCPVTGQPDFARLYIDYTPDRWLVESKSLKLYLASFRNHGAFHEVVTVTIGKKLQEALKPRWLRIYGLWFPRGGIPIDIFWQTGEPPEEILIPELDLKTYTGR